MQSWHWLASQRYDTHLQLLVSTCKLSVTRLDASDACIDAF